MKLHRKAVQGLGGLVDSNAQIRIVETGFQFLEGPLWDPRSGSLLFSDIPASRRFQWNGQSCAVLHEPTHMANGMTFDADFNLLVCEHETSALARFSSRGREVIASEFEGKTLNSPNDVIVASDGAVWFSDPTFGRMEGYGLKRDPDLDFQGVYRIPPRGGAAELMVDRSTFSQPNGLCFSPDESLMYVNDTAQGNIRVYDVVGGGLRNMRFFAEGMLDPDLPGAPDGIKCDTAGNVWCTAPGGLWVYAPDGALIGKIAVPEFVANFHWGGSDWRTLFITGSTSLYALDVNIGPNPEPFMKAHFKDNKTGARQDA